MVLTAQPDLPISRSITLHLINFDPTSPKYAPVFDMPQNMVGNIRPYVRGTAGHHNHFALCRAAPILTPAFTQEIFKMPMRQNTYILSGDGDETWTPAFTFHGFRYVEFLYQATFAVTPGTLPPRVMEPLTLATIEGLVYNSLPVTPSVRLTSSSETLNKMNELGAWGQRGKLPLHSTDCPQRDERLGWMGDVKLSGAPHI